MSLISISNYPGAWGTVYSILILKLKLMSKLKTKRIILNFDVDFEFLCFIEWYYVMGKLS